MKITADIKLLITSILPLLFLINSCSSGTATIREENSGNTKSEEAVKKPSRRSLNAELREREYIRSSNIKSIEKLEFEYGEDNKLIPAGKLSKVEYDAAGVLSATINYDNENNISSRFEYEYSGDGTRTLSKKYSPGGELRDIFKYEYDEDGYKVKVYRYNTAGELKNYYTYEYDVRGNLVEDKWYDASGNLEYLVEHSYDNHNQRSETRTYETGDELINKYTYKYDTSGNIVEEIKFDAAGKRMGVVQYIYTYH